VAAAPLTAEWGPGALFGTLLRHRALIRQFARREVEGRYRGSTLGLFWPVVSPVVQLVLYTFVFGVVFRARWPESPSSSLLDFALVLFCGFLAFSFFAECASRAVSLVLSVPNYVRKVVFPLEILPPALLASTLFHAGAGLGVLLLATAAVRGTLPPTVLLLPVVGLPLLLLSLGAAYFLASLGVFVRDLGFVVGLVVQVATFGTPIFYPPEAVPPAFRPLVVVNPLAAITDDFRRVLLWGRAPVWPRLLVWTALSAAVAVAGYAWFMKTKKAFADVM
jgi:lipopolysaccharide transport system permease protein